MGYRVDVRQPSLPKSVESNAAAAWLSTVRDGASIIVAVCTSVYLRCDRRRVNNRTRLSVVMAVYGVDDAIRGADERMAFNTAAHLFICRSRKCHNASCVAAQVNGHMPLALLHT
jgi:hypothetical protein